MRIALRARDGLVVGVLALSGFRYHGGERHVEALPRLPAGELPVLLVHGHGWGTFSYGAAGSPLTIRVLHGTLPCRSVTAWRVAARRRQTSVRVNGQGAQVRARATRSRHAHHAERGARAQAGLDLVIEL